MTRSTEQLSISAEELAPLVRRMLGDDDAVVVDMTVEPMGWLNIMAGQLHRAQGKAATGTGGQRRADWSMVLKVTRAPEHWPDSLDPDDWSFWKRELEVYRSGITADLPGGLGAPTFYGALERADDSLVLALEEVTPVARDAWSLARYSDAARVMGRSSAGYATDECMPVAPGSARPWIHSWTEQLVGVWGELPSDLWAHPLAAAAVPDREAVGRVADRHRELLATLGALPRTFAHGDATPGNLLVRPLPDGGEQFVAVDWMLAGPAAVGEEAAGMVGASLWQFLWDPADAAELEGAVLTGYLEGLREGGWTGSESDVRRAYAVHLALRIGLLIPAWAPKLDAAPDPSWYERRFGRPIDEVAAGWGRLSVFALGDRLGELTT